MSAVKKTAKVGLYVLSFLTLLVVGGGVYVYVNMNSLAKQISEQVASDALGVAVTIGDIDISVENKKVVVSDISIANPHGYKKPHAITVSNVTIAAESFSNNLLNFALVSVDGTEVNLEVKQSSTNLGDLKKNVDAKSAAQKSASAPAGSAEHPKKDIKVIVQKFALTKAQMTPSVTLLKKDLGAITVPDIHLNGIGENQNGVLAQDAIEQIMAAVLRQFNTSANSAGFLKGLSLDALNDIGVETLDVFKKNLKDSYKNEVDGFKKGLEGLKGMLK